MHKHAQELLRIATAISMAAFEYNDGAIEAAFSLNGLEEANKRLSVTIKAIKKEEM